MQRRQIWELGLESQAQATLLVSCCLIVAFVSYFLRTCPLTILPIIEPKLVVLCKYVFILYRV